MQTHVNLPLANARHEAFCQLIADGTNWPITDAWIESASAIGKPRPEKTPGARVAASRLASKYRGRIADLKRQRGKEGACDPKALLTAVSLASLMEEATLTLMQAVNVAQRAGAASLAQTLRKVVVTHAGRAHRVECQAPKIQEPITAVPVNEYLERLRVCECDQ